MPVQVNSPEKDETNAQMLQLFTTAAQLYANNMNKGGEKPKGSPGSDSSKPAASGGGQTGSGANASNIASAKKYETKKYGMA